MATVTFEILAFTTVVAFIAALIGAFLFSYYSWQKPQFAPRELIHNEDNSLVFLFDEEALVDASDRALALLESRPKGTSDWQRFCSLTHSRFPNLPLEMTQLAKEGILNIRTSDPSDKAEIRAEWWNGIARIELIEDKAAATETSIDPHSMNAMQNELATLRQTAEISPYLVWQQTGEGQITWANSSYMALAQEFDQSADNPVKTWPPARVFDKVSLSQGSPEGRMHRVSVTFPNEPKPRWYEVYSSTIGSESLHFATNADSAVRAETALRDFVQTLAKTFAHLPTGLAIFDKKRQLALFNPALTDLTGLQPMFLSLRPTLFNFLDKLREAQMIPEPKNYKSWRAQMAALEAAAEDGTFSETWSLASGQTYRVTGRPHPDGAVAFLFEDISSEMSLTRHFRGELEASQAVLDSFSEAIAVFTNDGMLTMSNSAYSELWGVDPGVMLGEATVTDAMKYWRHQSEPSSIWVAVQEYFNQAGPREKQSFNARLLNGRQMSCRLSPLTGGGTLIAFGMPQAQVKPLLVPVENEFAMPLQLTASERVSESKDAPLLKIEA
ncbi:PAS-domain containing protein [Falsihalocynthiibacter sp. SS001]|uniref:PAS-domain containing protein n=1 Tax=Falsihalocynthiibacter sp. SS001 TaxID=3349698 RepID=UPI0036D414B7